jgi:hypothetical protein
MYFFIYIIPFFESLSFLSRKKYIMIIEFLIVIKHKLGYFYLPIGKQIALQISEATNIYSILLITVK